jgi:DNA-binding MarR family transcriptional regulator
MNIDLLHKLIDCFYKYANNRSDEEMSMAAFSAWLNDFVSAQPRTYQSYDKAKDYTAEQPVDVQISIMLGRMVKYARVYSKKLLHDNNLSGLDDYTFLATLMFHPSMSKAELTHHNLTENTSGADIIKRLIKSGFMEEFDCPSDKRVRRVRITDLGKQTMFKVFEQMNPIAAIIPGNLAPDEKLYLLSYLKRLDAFHLEIYKNHRNSEIEEIREKYL